MRKTKILALCTMLLLLALVAGCGSPSMGVKENKADLTVTVVDANGAAVSDAVVSVNNDSNLTTTTDVTGKCTIKNVTLGGQTVRVSKIGYNDYASATNGVRIVDGANNHPVTLTYNGGGQVKVTVQDALGKSVGKAPVSVVNPITHQVIASTISSFEGVATLNVAVNSGFKYQVKVAAKDYKLLPIDNIDVTAGKATEVSAVIRSDVHPGTINLAGVRLTSDGDPDGILTGITARVVEANTGLETTPTGNDSVTVPAGTYVVGITLPTTYVSPVITGGDALDTTTITHYLPSAASGETIYRLVTVPLDGNVSINVQMSARPPAPPMPINTTDLTVSYETFTFAGMPANRTDLRVRGTFTSWGDDNPLMPLAEVNADNVTLQSGTGRYRLVTLIPCTLHLQAQAQFKASDAGWVTQSTATVEGDGTGGGNVNRMIPSAGHGLVHFSTTAPAGSTVEVRGTMNNWAGNSLVYPPIRLMETSAGNFERNVYLPAGGYEYKYVVNSSTWQPANNVQVTVTAEF